MSRDPLDDLMVQELDAFEVRAAIRDEELEHERDAEERALERGACVVCGGNMVEDTRDPRWLRCACGHQAQARRRKCRGCGRWLTRNASMQWCPECRVKRASGKGNIKVKVSGRARCTICKRRRVGCVSGVCPFCRRKAKEETA